MSAWGALLSGVLAVFVRSVAAAPPVPPLWGGGVRPHFFLWSAGLPAGRYCSGVAFARLGSGALRHWRSHFAGLPAMLPSFWGGRRSAPPSPPCPYFILLFRFHFRLSVAPADGAPSLFIISLRKGHHPSPPPPTPAPPVGAGGTPNVRKSLFFRSADG